MKIDLIKKLKSQFTKEELRNIEAQADYLINQKKNEIKNASMEKGYATDSQEPQLEIYPSK